LAAAPGAGTANNNNGFFVVCHGFNQTKYDQRQLPMLMMRAFLALKNNNVSTEVMMKDVTWFVTQDIAKYSYQVEAFLQKAHLSRDLGPRPTLRINL
jgi:hypothetical protein